MLRLGTLLVALLLLAYLLWSPAEAEQMTVAAVDPPRETLEQAPRLKGASALPPVAREEIVEVPDPEEYLNYEEADPELVEHGDCTLDLRLFDAHTAQPASSSVQLWRLDRAETSTWTRGDQLQVSSDDMQGVFRFSNLPEGDYRIYSLSARADAASPPAFRVEGESTSVEQFVDMPRKHFVKLHLYRPDGYPVTSTRGALLETRDRGTRYSLEVDPVPDWAHLRYPKGNYALVSERIGGGGFSGSSHRKWKPVFPGQDGIPIGSLKENDRRHRTEVKREIRVAGGLSMTVFVDHRGYKSYAAIFLDPAELQGHLVFPGGSTPRDFTTGFEVSSEAVPLGIRAGLPGGRQEASDADWWDVPVSIQLDTEEYEKVHITWRPSDGPLPPIMLQRKPEPPPE